MYGVVGKRRRDCIDANPSLATVAVCDQTFEAGGQLDGGVRRHRNYHDLLAEDLDALFVCLSNDMAAEVTIAGLEAGLHVFCEKPPGRDVAEVARVIAVEQRHKGGQAQIRLQPPLP